jgi:hypothetical protein
MPPTTQNIAEMKDVGTDEKQKIRLVSFNCKNIVVGGLDRLTKIDFEYYCPIFLV